MSHHAASICLSVKNVFFNMVNFQWRQPCTAVAAWARDAQWLQAMEKESNRVLFCGVLWCEQSAPTWRAWAENQPLAITYSCLEFTQRSGPGALVESTREWDRCIPTRLRFKCSSAQVATGDKEARLCALSEYHVGLYCMCLFLSQSRTILT